MTAGRRIERALLDAPLALAPCHNDLLNANFIDDGERIRIVDWEYAGMGDLFFDLGNFSINHELTPEQDATFLCAYDRTDAPDPARLARLTLMRVVSDFREAMWGVLQQAISTLDVDFVEYADEHFDRLLRQRRGSALRECPARGRRWLTAAAATRARDHRRGRRRNGHRLSPRRTWAGPRSCSSIGPS